LRHAITFGRNSKDCAPTLDMASVVAAERGPIGISAVWIQPNARYRTLGAIEDRGLTRNLSISALPPRIPREESTRPRSAIETMAGLERSELAALGERGRQRIERTFRSTADSGCLPDTRNGRGGIDPLATRIERELSV
jgi:hypothetical protein